jgi:hypothetical protein
LSIETIMALARLKSVADVRIPDTALCHAAVDLLEGRDAGSNIPLGRTFPIALMLDGGTILSFGAVKQIQ